MTLLALLLAASAAAPKWVREGNPKAAIGGGTTASAALADALASLVRGADLDRLEGDLQVGEVVVAMVFEKRGQEPNEEVSIHTRLHGGSETKGFELDSSASTRITNDGADSDDQASETFSQHNTSGAALVEALRKAGLTEELWTDPDNGVVWAQLSPRPENAKSTPRSKALLAALRADLAASKGRPAWVGQPVARQKEAFVAVGHGASYLEALAGALGDIASQLQTYADALTRDYQVDPKAPLAERKTFELGVGQARAFVEGSKVELRMEDKAKDPFRLKLQRGPDTAVTMAGDPQRYLKEVAAHAAVEAYCEPDGARAWQVRVAYDLKSGRP